MNSVESMADSGNEPSINAGEYQQFQTTKNYSVLYNIILALTLVAVSVQILHKESYTKALFDTVSTVTLSICIFGAIEICLRIYHFFMQLFQLKTKYEGDLIKVFEALYLNTVSLLTILLSLSVFLVLLITVGNTVDHIWSLRSLVIPAFVCSVVICQLIGLKNSKLATSEFIRNLGGVDYGAGMAYSYFYGYLKIVLPADGSNKGLRFKMEQYEANQNVTIPVKKLFILIPKSGHIPPDLKEASYNWLESTTGLESEVLDRAGVRSRKYRNTVYKIHPGGEGKPHRPVYVTTEGATPMLTLWEIINHSHPENGYREHRNQIIDAFCETLQSLLDNDPRCTDVCELVIYNDRDAKNKLVNVGEILLQRIRQQAGYSV